MLFQRQPGCRRLFTRAVKVLLYLYTVFASLAQSPSSPSELMQQVFNALERRDEAGLKALAITKADFKKFIWPNLSRTVVGKLGIKADALYSMSVKESDIGLALTLKEYGGRKWNVIRVASLTPEHHPIRRKRLRAYSGPGVTILCQRQRTNGSCRWWNCGTRQRVQSFDVLPYAGSATVTLALPTDG
jgi:hypothetical protein